MKLVPEFSDWIGGLKDLLTQKRLVARLKKAQLGNLGDVKPVGHGVQEMREDFGPGWRMYFTRRGRTMIVLLAGGDKCTQTADIAKAVTLAERLEG